MESKKLAAILVLIGIIVVVLIGFCVWFFQPSLLSFLRKEVVKTPVEVVVPQQQISGTLFFSLFPDNTATPLGIYSYKFISGRLQRVLVDPSTSAVDYSIRLSPSFSDDESIMVFAGRKISEPAIQIYTALPDGTGIRQITNGPEVFKREPIISPSKSLIAYISQREDLKEGETTEFPEGWTVFLTNLSGKAVKVSNGVNPLFSPDETKLLVLKNDGLYIFDIKDTLNPKEIGVVVKTVDGRASQTMKLSLSRDRNMLAWSSPGKKNVVVSKINSWESFSITPIKVFQVKAYWSVFSPDGKSLGLQEIRVSEKTGNEYVVISVYDIATSVATDIIKLNKYTNEFLWFGGWIK